VDAMILVGELRTKTHGTGARAHGSQAAIAQVCTPKPDLIERRHEDRI
jgi:hypothetical protein